MKTAFDDPPSVADATAAHVGRILVPTDFSPLSKSVVDATVAMLDANPETSLTLMHVIDPMHPGEYADSCAALHHSTLSSRINHADRQMRDLRAKYGDKIELETRIVAGNAAHAICEMAQDEGYDLIVMSSHGHAGLARVLIGSVAEQVVQEAPCPILVAKHLKNQAGESLSAPVPLKFARLLVGYDHRAGARHALGLARELARPRGSHLILVHALEPEPIGVDPLAASQIQAARLQETLEKLTSVRTKGLPATEDWDLRVEVGEAWDVIVRIAKETCSDLIVVGPHEHTRWGHCYVGSTAQRVVRLAPCPVLVVK